YGGNRGSGRLRPPRTRTAILFPVYHERVEPLTVQLQQLLDALARLRGGEAFDVIVLSDSQDPAAIARERSAWKDLCGQSEDRRVPLYYRHRDGNVGRKPGSIAQWCQQWGRAYDFMVVLDADSIMDAGTLLRLVLAMEDYPEAGLMQTVPRLLPGRTLFG